MWETRLPKMLLFYVNWSAIVPPDFCFKTTHLQLRLVDRVEFITRDFSSGLSANGKGRHSDVGKCYMFVVSYFWNSFCKIIISLPKSTAYISFGSSSNYINGHLGHDTMAFLCSLSLFIYSFFEGKRIQSDICWDQVKRSELGKDIFAPGIRSHEWVGITDFVTLLYVKWYE